MAQESLNERVKRIQGDKEEINRLIDEYKPFIAARAQKHVGRYLRYGEDDELSIALMAFYEAIGSYNSIKGSFLNFSNHIIKRRMIDYYRKEKRGVKVVPIQDYICDSDEETDLSDVKSIEQYEIDEENENRRLEIEEFNEQLSKWGISFDDLVKSSPGQDRTKEMCSRILRFLLGSHELIKHIKTKKTLPVSTIEKSLGISPKKIEKHRKYIIAALLIYTGSYPYLRKYIVIGKDKRGGQK